MVALINYMSQILVELVKLANLIININKSIACGNRIQSIFEMQPSITDGSGQKVDKVQTDTADRSEEAEYAVEFSHVGLTYAGAGDESLTDIDFKVKKGETIGIIGGTGSGKSSVVNLIPRFYDVTSGFIKVDGKDVKDYPLEELRGKIGTVLQKAVLFHGTIRENLKWGNPDATEEDLNRAITVAQAKEFVDNKEGGLDFEIEQGGKNLSGGQRQRLTIARAVVKKPEILILDDSASALDFATDAALRKAIREMEGETTVFIVSQRAASIQHADRIVVLDDGKIVGLGTSEELLESCEVYQEIYNSQFKKQEGGKTA